MLTRCIYIYLKVNEFKVFFPSNSFLHIYIFYSREDETEGQMFIYICLWMCFPAFSHQKLNPVIWQFISLYDRALLCICIIIPAS